MGFALTGGRLDPAISLYAARTKSGGGGGGSLNINSVGVVIENDGSAATIAQALGKPSGISAGDTIAVFWFSGGPTLNPTPAEQANWTQYSPMRDNWHGVWYRTATGTSADDYTVPATAGGNGHQWSIVMVKFSLPCEPYQIGGDAGGVIQAFPIKAMSASVDGATAHLITAHYTKYILSGAFRGALSIVEPSTSMLLSYNTYQPPGGAFLSYNWFWSGVYSVGFGLDAVAQEDITVTPFYWGDVESEFIRWRTV